MQRPSTRGAIDTDDQLDLQALYRVRSRLIGNRTAVINQLCASALGRMIAWPLIHGVRRDSPGVKRDIPHVGIHLGKQHSDFDEIINADESDQKEQQQHGLHDGSPSKAARRANISSTTRNGAMIAAWFVVTEQCRVFCRELLFDGFNSSCESLAIHALVCECGGTGLHLRY